ncbi:MAG: carboxypeptidase M32, partial [Saprospiraceae bacterium]|nr:carboxypeptidase M32 [Saprospiraceae bacterium]
EFGLEVLKAMGYDLDHGRQDISPHPFTISFSPEDVRVTTRIDEHDFLNMTWSCIHEGGHALYEQGLPAEQYGLPLGSSASLGIHESQSRLWENHVGRGLPFWEHWYPQLQERFPEQLGGISLERFHQAINRIAPNYIRTEADELHYHLHVMIRYEIEREAINTDLPVARMKALWNDKYEAYLGLDTPDDANGILQDVHWSHGSFGYFPTYSIGSFYAAQFFAAAEAAIPGLDAQIRNGDNSQLLQWLRTEIHAHGRMYDPEDLCQRVTGQQLDVTHFVHYMREKLTQLKLLS